MTRKAVPALILLASMIVLAADASERPSKPRQKSASDSSTVERPRSFDLSAIDKTVDPCMDFYEYACGSWRKNNPIPPDQARWGRFNQLAEYNRQVLRDILENAATASNRTPVVEKIGDYYQSCMAEEEVNGKGFDPIKSDLDHIASIETRSQLIDTLSYLQAKDVQVVFAFSSQPDLHDASREIAGIRQGG